MSDDSPSALLLRWDRLVAFAPLVAITLMTAGAAFVGLRTGTDSAPGDPRWADAQRQLVKADQGHFLLRILDRDCGNLDESECEVGAEEFTVEGRFGISPNFSFYIHRSGSRGFQYDRRVLHFPDGRTFEQSSPPEPTCWTLSTPALETEEFGSILPTGVRIMLETTVLEGASPSGGNTVVGLAPLELALRLFLIPRYVEPEVQEGRVRVVIRLGPDGLPTGFRLGGLEVEAALRAIGRNDDAYPGVFNHDAEFTIDLLGSEPNFEAPNKAEIAATGGTGGTCIESDR